MLEMNDIEQNKLMQALERMEGIYDPEVKMLREPFHTPGYHTTLKGGYVHLTRNSLTYAVALLDSGIIANETRAIDIINKIISLQDINPENKTYGIWSWYYEEPLEKMSPPDWNWADFCGKELLQVVIDYEDRLPKDFMKKVRESILHASKSIRMRNMGPGYTNISIMGTYVTLVAGEHYNLPELFDYAKSRLFKLHEYSTHHGAFTEYNSPTYTVVALEDLSRMLNHVKNEECFLRIQDLNSIGWKCFAEHYHPSTRQ